MITIANKHKPAPGVKVYCGRGSIFGNPYSHIPSKYPDVIQVATRDEACDKYEEYFKTRLNDPIFKKELNRITVLASKIDIALECYCAPKRCHCETIKNHIEQATPVWNTCNTVPEVPVKTPLDDLPKYDPKVQSMTYAGIGSRETPHDILEIMNALALYLQDQGYTLRSGGALGADKAFEGAPQPLEKTPSGAVTKWSSTVKIQRKEIYKAEDANDRTREIAKFIHPAGEKLKDYALALHARNTFQLLGKSLDTPSDFVVCWTKDGIEHGKDRTAASGGTGQAIDLASRLRIPVFNLANKNALARLEKHLKG